MTTFVRDSLSHALGTLIVIALVGCAPQPLVLQQSPDSTAAPLLSAPIGAVLVPGMPDEQIHIFFAGVRVEGHRSTNFSYDFGYVANPYVAERTRCNPMAVLLHGDFSGQPGSIKAFYSGSVKPQKEVKAPMSLDLPSGASLCVWVSGYPGSSGQVRPIVEYQQR